MQCKILIIVSIYACIYIYIIYFNLHNHPIEIVYLLLAFYDCETEMQGWRGQAERSRYFRAEPWKCRMWAREPEAAERDLTASPAGGPGWDLTDLGQRKEPLRPWASPASLQSHP